MMKDRYKVLIISCWSLLGICFLVKLLGANIFIASSENERFITLCNYIDTTFIRYIILYISNIISGSIYYMAVLKNNKPKIKWLIPYCIYVIIKFIFEDYVSLFFLLDVAIMTIYPILFDKTIWKRAIIGFGLNLGFQLISQFLKLNNFAMFDDNTLVFLLLSIDYYIMLILYWLYSTKRKEMS